MATYLILNVLFATLVCGVLKISPMRTPSRATVSTLVALLVLTVLFDNLMIYLSFFSYDPSKILGISVGLAPIEDFMYALLAAMVVPVLWNKFEGVKRDK